MRGIGEVLTLFLMGGSCKLPTEEGNFCNWLPSSSYRVLEKW